MRSALVIDTRMRPGEGTAAEVPASRLPVGAPIGIRPCLHSAEGHRTAIWFTNAHGQVLTPGLSRMDSDRARGHRLPRPTGADLGAFDRAVG